MRKSIVIKYRNVFLAVFIMIFLGYGWNASLLYAAASCSKDDSTGWCTEYDEAGVLSKVLTQSLSIFSSCRES